MRVQRQEYERMSALIFFRATMRWHVWSRFKLVSDRTWPMACRGWADAMAKEERSKERHLRGSLTVSMSDHAIISIE
jgi:hypothetical protein